MEHTCAEVRSELDKLKSKQQKRFEVFKSQDTENGFFDVAFHIGKEKLHAHKFMLAGMSKPFAVMFSKRWATTKKFIKIDNYSFDDFKEFLSHFYSSEPLVNDDNVFTMVDMAEYYDVMELKKKCDRFLSKMKVTPENVIQMFEFSQKYPSLSRFSSSLMTKNLSCLLGCNDFLSIKKEMLKDIVDLERLYSQEEELFEAVYKWAVHQVNTKHTSTDDKTCDLNESIKEELSEILPKIRFERMSSNFLIDFVVPKGFLFSSYQDLSDILHRANNGEVSVKVVSRFDGKTASGKLTCESSMVMNIYDAINMTNDSNLAWQDDGRNSRDSYSSDDDGTTPYQFWRTKLSRPSTPSHLKLNYKVRHYLLFDDANNFAVKETSQIRDDDYLLAELAVEDALDLTLSCKIEAFYTF